MRGRRTAASLSGRNAEEVAARETYTEEPKVLLRRRCTTKHDHGELVSRCKKNKVGGRGREGWTHADDDDDLADEADPEEGIDQRELGHPVERYVPQCEVRKA